MKKCKACRSAEATEGRYCFACAEETAYLLAECAAEFGYDPKGAAAAAWK